MTLEQILQTVGAYVDQDGSTPTDDDLTNRIKFADFAYQEWAMSYDWDELKSEYKTTTVAASQVTVALPSNFKNVGSELYYYDNELPTEYPVKRPEEVYDLGDDFNYCYVLGDRSSGYNLIVPKGLPSGASLAMTIYSFPSSLASLTDIPRISDPNYIVQRTISLVLEGRGDTRFPQAKQDAFSVLANMVQHQNINTFYGGNNTVRNMYAEKRRGKGFRVGRR